jgi:hypothetical protein
MRWRIVQCSAVLAEPSPLMVRPHGQPAWRNYRPESQNGEPASTSDRKSAHKRVPTTGPVGGTAEAQICVSLAETSHLSVGINGEPVSLRLCKLGPRSFANMVGRKKRFFVWRCNSHPRVGTTTHFSSASPMASRGSSRAWSRGDNSHHNFPKVVSVHHNQGTARVA